MKEKKYKNIEEIETDLRSFFDLKTTEFYQKGIFELPERWRSVVDMKGDYFDF